MCANHSPVYQCSHLVSSPLLLPLQSGRWKYRPLKWWSSFSCPQTTSLPQLCPGRPPLRNWNLILSVSQKSHRSETYQKATASSTPLTANHSKKRYSWFPWNWPPCSGHGPLSSPASLPLISVLPQKGKFWSTGIHPASPRVSYKTCFSSQIRLLFFILMKQSGTLIPINYFFST